jgi:hypothetical protein
VAYAVPCGVAYKFSYSDVCIALTLKKTLPFKWRPPLTAMKLRVVTLNVWNHEGDAKRLDIINRGMDF